ncbi:uncharacterized protein LAJ45_01816 [Morchella importuna]|uniref:uncharacterized protein n=1 Tax=Morchella importuna TaxID=1174673 RepID=UPI001E8E6312|nr:uncharacterized protein LAJ45_01816 [Morchella importuna]KAH8154049.1 hypothetical protein LAJ45_01816 [Morchella importuna]
MFLRSRADLIELSLLYSTCIRDEPLAVFGFVLPEIRPRVAKKGLAHHACLVEHVELPSILPTDHHRPPQPPQPQPLPPPPPPHHDWNSCKLDTSIAAGRGERAD